MPNARLAKPNAREEAEVALYSGSLARSPARDPVALETDLRRALEKDEIEVYYQPIVRLKDGAIAGFEALLRWRHPQGGLIQPDEFVAHAERSDLIVDLGRQALRLAAKDLSRWQQFFPSRPPLYVSVNVTWRQIADEGFARELGMLLKRAGLAKESLRLEVTESAVMAGAESAEAGLQRLKAMGASLAIDDFGTGHSSLSQLARLPFDTLKIDKSFMTSVRNDGAGPKVLASILSLAHELKLVAIAEGVETEEDVALLKSMGCEQGQGFLFGAPMPAAEVFGFIAAARAELSAAGVRDEARGADAEPGKRSTPLRLRIGSEHQCRIGLAMDPAVELELVLHLARAPAGIAEREQRVLRPAPLGDGAQDVERRGQRYVLGHRKGRVAALVVAAMQHEARARFRPGRHRGSAARRPRGSSRSEAASSARRTRARVSAC